MIACEKMGGMRSVEHHIGHITDASDGMIFSVWLFNIHISHPAVC